MQKEFYRLYNIVKDETRYLSYQNTDNIYFQKLMAMGPDIIPLLLNNLWDSWWAIVGLHYLTKGAVIIAEQDLGRFDLISQAWYNWGKSEGHI